MYLNEEEKAQLRSFADNTALKNAVKKVILADVYANGTLEAGEEAGENKNWVFGLMMNEQGMDYKQTNEEIGEKLRACIEGIRTVQLAFKKIEEFKTVINIPVDDTNIAR